MPSLALPDLTLVAALWPAALGIALMSFTETVATARTFCQHDDAPVNPNQEMLAVGTANLASALAGGLPSGGGASQTAVADQAGVRSQLAQWINAAAVLLTVQLLARPIGLMPKAALGALILVAAVSMIKPESFRAIARVRRDELMWSLVTAAGVISILTIIYQANHPPVYAVAYNRQQRIFRRAGEDDSDETCPGLLILRTEGRLTFANAANVQEKIKALVLQTQPRVIIMECSAIPDIEYTALTMLTEAEATLRARGISLWLAAVNPDLWKIVQRAPLAAALGRERLFFNLHKALEAWQRCGPGALPE